jgi:spermidine/putrescine transport system ATP-binding protein
VTHDQTEALALSHRIAVMNKGRVEQVDEPSKIYNFPATRFVADFIGTCNLLDGVVTAAESGPVTIDVEGLGPVHAKTALRTAVGARAAIALRPEKIRIDPAAGDAVAGNRFRGTITDFLYLGDVTVYRISTPGGMKLEALLANSESGRTRFFETGDTVTMSWPADAGHFLAS